MQTQEPNDALRSIVFFVVGGSHSVWSRVISVGVAVGVAVVIAVALIPTSVGIFCSCNCCVYSVGIGTKFVYKLAVLLQQFINMRLLFIDCCLMFFWRPSTGRRFVLSFAGCAPCWPLPLPPLCGDCLLGVLYVRLCLLPRWCHSQTYAYWECCLGSAFSRSICPWNRFAGGPTSCRPWVFFPSHQLLLGEHVWSIHFVFCLYDLHAVRPFDALIFL